MLFVFMLVLVKSFNNCSSCNVLEERNKQCHIQLLLAEQMILLLQYAYSGAALAEYLCTKEATLVI
jgi:hypothetical protein